jgi:molecular chaperone GrpE
MTKKKISEEDKLDQDKASPKEKETDLKDVKSSSDTGEQVEPNIEAVKIEAKESYDRFLRLSAEFENYKKRVSREMNDLRKYANEALIRELLLVVDNLERAIDSSSGDSNSASIIQGVDLTLQDILKIFEKHSVKPIDSLGKTFDPIFHQAVAQEESESHPGNTVVKELQKGYTIHDRLLRPAMVIVSKNTAVASDTESRSDGDDKIEQN